MHDLNRLTMSEVALLAAELRKLGEGMPSAEAASQCIARYLFSELRDGESERSGCILVRCFKTHPFDELPPTLQRIARGIADPVDLKGVTRCLTLLGTYGEEPCWRERRLSGGHQVIPLASEQVLESFPMISRLTRSLGLETHHVVHPDPAVLLEKDRKGFNVLHIEEASGDPNIPAQDFIKKYGVRSVVGLGFAFPPSDIFACIIFTRTKVDAATAGMFKVLALSLKLAILPLSSKTFEPEGDAS